MKIILLLFSLLLDYVKLDLPIHCLKDQIQGKWEFEIEEKTKDMNPLENNCGHEYPSNPKTSLYAKQNDFKPFMKMNLHLHDDGTVSEQEALSRFKEQGDRDRHDTRYQKKNMKDAQQFMELIGRIRPNNRFYQNIWTMIYDEGFELNYNHQRIFVYLEYYYDRSNNSNILSNCSRSLVGWYHNYLTNEYSCVRGQKVSEFVSISSDKQRENVNSDQDDEIRDINRFSQKNSHSFLPLDFKDHQYFADKINSLNLSYTAEVPLDFKDLSIEELNKRAGRSTTLKDFQKYMFRQTRGGYLVQKEEDLSDLPSDFSWEVLLEKVKNQGRCGSCFIFATFEMLHARIKLFYNISTELSYQHAMDCMYFNQGCEGGFASLVNKFGNEAHFLEYSCKKYSSKKQPCQQLECDPSSIKRVFKIGEYGLINGVYGQINQRQIMEEIIKNGPVVLSLDVDYPFMIYKKGIYTRTPAQWIQLDQQRPQWTRLAHSVVCYGWGYDMDSGKKYWLIRNSWGEKWGEKGHMRIERGLDILGVESSPEYAIPYVVDLNDPKNQHHKDILSFYKQK